MNNLEQDKQEQEEPVVEKVNWPIVIISLLSFLFVVYLIYAQYKANH